MLLLKKKQSYSATIIWSFVVILLVIGRFDSFYAILIDSSGIMFVSVIGLMFAIYAEILLTKRNAFDMIITRLNKNKQPKQTIKKGNQNEKTTTQQKNSQENQQLQTISY